ncbi:MAG: DAK2 domain-containing protein [Anaerolineae bacterium]
MESRDEISQPILECDGQLFKRLLEAATIWLEKHTAFINSLNVYPVPDGDTGTNMLLTMQAVLKEIAPSPEHSIGAMAQVVAYGARMGSRGNSGVILSQIFRGMAKNLDGKEAMRAIDLAASMREAARTAYKGVIKPVEGTILTVAREVAEAAEAAASHVTDLCQLLEIMVHEARESVARTPSLLPVLQEAGVVDAGGQGLCVILEGFLRYMQGQPLDVDVALNTVSDLKASFEGEYGYDVQFVLRGRDLDVESIRTEISQMGESALVVGDSASVKVHIHTQEPGTPLNYAASLGSLSKITVENMQEQYQEFVLKAAQGAAAPTEVPASKAKASEVAIVTVASGEGLMKVFKSLGASAIVSGGQTMNPSTEELLKAIEGLESPNVIVLPNNPNIIMASRQAGEMTKKNVRIVPSKTIPQGISALLAFSYQADWETNLKLMEQALRSVKTAEITTAVRAVQVNGLSVKEGEFIGLLDDQLQASGHSLMEIAFKLLSRMRAEENEIITVYYGKDVSQEEAEKLAEEIRKRYPGQEVELIDGSQPYYHYILSVE